MTTALKLIGVYSYMSAAFGDVNLQKDDVVLVNDDVAEKLLSRSRMSDSDGIEIKYFAVAGEKDAVKYDFTTRPAPAATDEQAVATVALVARPDGPVVAAARKRAAQRPEQA